MKKILFTAILLMTSLTIAAQTPDEVTLTVSGSGGNEEKAILVALRSAIEQTYGTFVSANTDILNDQLVKDEIVSISAGNIKSYKKLSSVTLTGGRILVTLSATVSIGKLVSYAQSKGATTEFAGATLAMNVKLMELREKNTIKALCNMWKTVSELSKKAFDYKIEVGQPKIVTNAVLKENMSWKKSNLLNPDVFWIKIKEEKGYRIPIVVTALANEYTSQIEELVKNTFQSLRLKENEYSEWYNLFGKYPSYDLPIVKKIYRDKFIDEGEKVFHNIVYSLLNFVIEENSDENVSYTVQWGYDDRKNLIIGNPSHEPFSYSSKRYEYLKKFHIVDNKGVIHYSLEKYPRYNKKDTNFFNFCERDASGYPSYSRSWCGGFLFYYDEGHFYFDRSKWMLPVKITKTQKKLAPAIEEELQEQYKKAIEQGDKDVINEFESKLYDYSTVYEKVEQPLNKITFEIFVPYERMYKLKGFTIKKGKIL